MNYMHIDEDSFAVLDEITDGLNLTLHLRPVNSPERRPFCGNIGIVKNGPYLRKIRDLPMSGKFTGFVIHGHRYICKSCGHTFVDEFTSIQKDAKITNRLSEYIIKKSITQPFAQIARDVSMSETEIKSLFSTYADAIDKTREIKAPRVLGIDENHLMGNYRAVFTDIEGGLLLDILPKRNKSIVERFLKALHAPETVEVVTMDMWRPYRDAVRETLPNAVIVIDKFHVIKEVNDALEDIRKKLRGSIASSSSRALKRSRWLMLKNLDSLNANDIKLLDALFNEYPVFQEPYALKEDFRNIYLCRTRQDAEQAYQDWVQRASKIEEFSRVAETLSRWHEEIFSYFEHPYTNALTESLNHKINEIARLGRGYSFAVLRTKVLHNTSVTQQPKYEYSSMPDHQFSFAYTTRFLFPKKTLLRGSGVIISKLMEIDPKALWESEIE